MDMSKKKDLLKKMQMPKKAADPMLDLDAQDQSLDGPSDMPPSDGSEQDKAFGGKESPGEERSELHGMPDEDLAKELEKRGWHCEGPSDKEGSPEEESSESPEQEQSEQSY